MKMTLSVLMAFVFSFLMLSCDGKEDEMAANSSTEITTDEDGRELIGTTYVSGYPIVKEDFSFSVAVPAWAVGPGKPLSERKNMADYAALTGMNPEWIMPESEKMNLMFTSNDAPDVLFSNAPSNIDLHIQEGSFLEVSDLLENYAPNLMKAIKEAPIAAKLIKEPDGKIFRIPSFYRNKGEMVRGIFFINKEWLATLGLNVPETTEDLYEALKAFKDGDPNGNGLADEIPISFNWTNTIHGVASLFGAWGTASVSHGTFVIKDDVLIMPSMEAGYKDAIRFFHRLYAEGLMDKESFTQDHTALVAKLSQEPSIVGAFNNWDRAEPLGGDSAAFERGERILALVPPLTLPGSEERYYIYDPVYGVGTYNFITADAENPVALMRWIDGIADPDRSYQWNVGPLGINVELTEDGKYKSLEPPEGMDGGTFRMAETMVFPVLGLYDSWYLENLYKDPNKRTGSDDKLDNLIVQLEPYLNMTGTNFLKFTAEEKEKINRYSVDIENYIDNKEASWIVNGNIDDEYDDYIKTLKNTYDIEELQNIHEAALKRWNED